MLVLNKHKKFDIDAINGFGQSARRKERKNCIEKEHDGQKQEKSSSVI